MKSNFQISLPVELCEKSKQGWKIKGVASTDDKDLQGEIVKQQGLDFSHIRKGLGLFNWNHKNDPQYILGKIDKAYLDKQNRSIVEGYLFEHQDNAKAIVNIMKSLEPEDKHRIQMSIEGKIVQRSGNSGSTIKQAKVEKVALTLDAVNRKTYTEFAKSLLSDEDVDTDEDTLKKVDIKGLDDKIEALTKMLTVGDGGDKAPGTRSGGSAIVEEDLDDDLTDVGEKKCPGSKIRSKGKGRGKGVGEKKGPIGRHGDIDRKGKGPADKAFVDDDENDNDDELKKPTKKAFDRCEAIRLLHKATWLRMKKAYPDLSLDTIMHMTDNLVEEALEKGSKKNIVSDISGIVSEIVKLKADDAEKNKKEIIKLHGQIDEKLHNYVGKEALTPGEKDGTKKSLSFALDLMKGGKGLPVGTIRDWKGQKYKKEAEGKWVPVKDPGDGGKAPEGEEKKPGGVDGIKEKVSAKLKEINQTMGKLTQDLEALKVFDAEQLDFAEGDLPDDEALNGMIESLKGTREKLVTGQKTKDKNLASKIEGGEGVDWEWSEKLLDRLVGDIEHGDIKYTSEYTDKLKELASESGDKKFSEFVDNLSDALDNAEKDDDADDEIANLQEYVWNKGKIEGGEDKKRSSDIRDASIHVDNIVDEIKDLGYTSGELANSANELREAQSVLEEKKDAQSMRSLASTAKEIKVKLEEYEDVDDSNSVFEDIDGLIGIEITEGEDKKEDKKAKQ